MTQLQSRSRAQLPQAPRNRTLVLSETLCFPRIEPLSQLALRCKVSEANVVEACRTSKQSLERFSSLVGHFPTSRTAYPGLFDELAGYVTDRPALDRPVATAKTHSEFAVCLRTRAKAERLRDMHADQFAAMLLDVHRRFGTGANGFRSRPIGIRPDSAGNRILFPSHRHARTLIDRLHAYLKQHLFDYPILCATVAYAAIIHAHPFSDGNGRTARTIYNMIVAAGTGSRHFVPLHLLAAAGDGSFMIKLRRVLLGNEWAELQGFFSDAIRLSAELQQSGFASAEERPAARSVVVRVRGLQSRRK